MSVPRPYRARAFAPHDPTHGRARPVTGHAAAKTREGLDRFVTAHRAAGDDVQIVEVLELLDQDDDTTDGRATRT